MRLSISARWSIPCLLLLATLPHTAHAASCSFNQSSLQSVFDDMFGPTLAPNTTTDCLADSQDSLWHTDRSVGSATILVEIAGNANGNAFGIYDSTSTLNSLEIFSGPAATASRAFITVSGSTGAYHVQIDRFTESGFAGSVSSVFATSAFGFYLQQPDAAGGDRFYSESFRNAGRNGNATATDYMLAYLGNGATFRTGSSYAPDVLEGTQFDSSDAILAWEDLRLGSDDDFQDMVVLLRDIGPTPVPLPAAVWLLGSALVGCTVLGRKRLT